MEWETPMERAEIFAQMKDAIVEQLGCDADAVVESASFTKDLEADSLDMIELVTQLEEKLDIAIPDESLEKIETVGQALDEIAKLV